MKTIILSLIVTLILAFSPQLWANDSQVVEPVQIFIQYYGKDMEKVAEITTLEFREGKSKLEWVAHTGKMLRSFGYERLQSEIRETVKHDGMAYVHVRAKIDTMIGHVEHDELYRVVRDGDKWKIDGLEVVRENIEARMEINGSVQ